ncbi:hypothetical protein [Streptomyces sp. TRM64462]|nr:hypothetical protein [Streptomyces sp. TRM64462]
MTMRVYAVRPDGTIATIRERVTVRDTDPPPQGPGFPPCICPRCAPGAKR